MTRRHRSLDQDGNEISYKQFPPDPSDPDLIDMSGQVDDNGTMRAMTFDETAEAEAWNERTRPKLVDRTGIAAQDPDKTAAEIRLLNVTVAELTAKLDVLIALSTATPADMADAVVVGRTRAQAELAAGDDGLVERLQQIVPRETPDQFPRVVN